MNEKLKNVWVVNGLLAVIAVLLGGYYANRPSQKAYAGGWETGGIMALASTGENERLVIVDTTKKNIMVYRAQGAGMFRMVGARSYKYDVELEDTAGSPYEKNVAHGTYAQVYKDYMASTSKK